MKETKYTNIVMVVTLAIICLAMDVAAVASVPIPESAISLSGTGLSAELVRLDPGLAIFNMTFDGSNFDVELLDHEGNLEHALAFVLDPFEGLLSKAVGVREGGLYALDIDTDGNWTIDITQPIQ